MTQFVEALPDSSTLVLYFTVQRRSDIEVVPVLHDLCKRWNPDIPGCEEDLLVIRSRGSDGYVSLYRTSALHNRAVEGVHWGDHWTVGLFISFHLRVLMLDSHKTRYIPSEEQPNQVQILRTACNTIFDDSVTEETACVVDGVPHPNVTLGVMYRNQKTYVLPLLQRIQAIYQGEITPQKGGNTPQSEVQDTLLTERGDRWKDDVVHFIAEQLVRPLAVLRPELTSVFLVYDCEREGFAVRHNFGEDEGREGTIFHINKELARRAFAYATMSQEARRSLPPEVRDEQEADLAMFRTQFGLIEGVV